jgi:hypothetical protein
MMRQTGDLERDRDSMKSLRALTLRFLLYLPPMRSKREAKSPMNRHENRLTTPGEAQIQYLDADFRILKPGNFVRCAVTGTPIALDELRYWSVDRQEAYATREAALERLKSLGVI